MGDGAGTTHISYISAKPLRPLCMINREHFEHGVLPRHSNSQAALLYNILGCLVYVLAEVAECLTLASVITTVVSTATVLSATAKYFSTSKAVASSLIEPYRRGECSP